MDRPETDMRGSVGENQSQTPGKITSTHHIRALLVGLVHQLGVFLTHSSSSYKALVTSVLFDQLLRHMNLLEKMYRHHREIIVQRIGRPISPGGRAPHYRISLGDLTVNSMSSVISSGKAGAGLQVGMDAALGQAFDCFAAHGIDSLRLTLPGDSDDKIDQLRLTLNIVARFHSAVENSASIVFRYFGRSIRVPVVNDNLGRPDPNLTSTAGLNGISAANVRELVKQADACRELISNEGKSLSVDAAKHYNGYDLLFGFTGLSVQLIRPQIEINTLPWIVEQCVERNIPDAEQVFQELDIVPDDNDSEQTTMNPRFAWRSFSVERFREPVTSQFLVDLLKTNATSPAEAIGAVTADDFDRLDIQGVGQRLLAASVVLKAIGRHNRDPLIVDRLVYHLHDRFLLIPETVLTNIEVQRKGIKLHEHGSMFVVGMLHPRLLDMIVLVKSAVVTRQKMRAAANVSFSFNYPNVRMLSEGFGIDAINTLHLLRLLKGTISSAGRFNRAVFEGQREEMGRYGDTLFEIYYCLLKQMSRRMDRLLLLDAFSFMASHLKNPAIAMRFLLDTIFQPDHQINFSDRNAFVVANCLLLERNTLYPDSMEQTPDIWLSMDCRTHPDVLKYACWRMKADKVFVGIKLEKVQMAILHSLVAQPGARSKDASFLIALEREALIFLSLTGTDTARTILRRALLRYSDPQSAVYQSAFTTSYIGVIMDHLRTIIFGIGRTGNLKDITALKALAGNLERLAALDAGTDYSQKIEQALHGKEAALQAIRSRHA